MKKGVPYSSKSLRTLEREAMMTLKLVVEFLLPPGSDDFWVAVDRIQARVLSVSVNTVLFHHASFPVIIFISFYLLSIVRRVGLIICSRMLQELIVLLVIYNGQLIRREFQNVCVHALEDYQTEIWIIAKVKMNSSIWGILLLNILQIHQHTV